MHLCAVCIPFANSCYFEYVHICPFGITHILYRCDGANIVTKNEAQNLSGNGRQNSEGLLFCYTDFQLTSTPAKSHGKLTGLSVLHFRDVFFKGIL
jgi:hypothetical protein